MAGHGGARPGAGKPKGSRNKATLAQKATLSDMAKALAPQALQALQDVMLNGQSESARVAAANAILDRGYGRPLQAAEDGDGDEAASLTISIKAAAPVGDIRVTRSDG